MDGTSEATSTRDTTEKVDMRIDPARASQLASNLSKVTAQMSAVSHGRPVRLVAVSKLKPVNDILALHQHSQSQQRHFGENYLQELAEKASILPRSIRWHFIGALQTNKCGALAQIPNLFVVSSVDAQKKADALNKGRGRYLSSNNNDQQPQQQDDDDDDDGVGRLLGVHVQVNTSGEESKSGVKPDQATELCRYIREECEWLRLRGLMAIGAIARSQAMTPDTENEDFRCLRDTRDRVARELGVGLEELELSMGMSEDFEGAIRAGSDEVRVGSTIFGPRPSRKDAKVKEEDGNKHD